MRARRARASISPRLVAAAASLGVDVVTAEVAESFRSAGIRCILLRGPSIARHLYNFGESREYEDVDLLVAPSTMGEAERILADRGFEHLAVLGQRPDDRPAWARTWVRPADRGDVDLHRTLVGIRVKPEEVWKVFSAHIEPIEVARARMNGLDAEATAIVVALHAAHHGSAYTKLLDDLSRALNVLPERTWHAAATLAGQLAATPAFAAGLRLLPAGVKLAERLELPHDTSAEVILRSGSAAPMALGFDWLSQTPGARAKLRLVAGKVTPDAEFMRAWSRLARRGRLGLVAAYLWRPLWLLLHAGPGYRAWRKARKQAE
jgi:hypothetical protein